MAPAAMRKPWYVRSRPRNSARAKTERVVSRASGLTRNRTPCQCQGPCYRFAGLIPCCADGFLIYSSQIHKILHAPEAYSVQVFLLDMGPISFLLTTILDRMGFGRLDPSFRRCCGGKVAFRSFRKHLCLLRSCLFWHNASSASYRRQETLRCKSSLRVPVAEPH